MPLDRAPQRPTPATAAERLRVETADLHAAVERHIDLQRLTEDRGRYAELLRYFLSAVGPVEAALRDAGHEAAAEDAALLEADLRRVGDSAPPAAATFELPAGPAAAWGAAYVLEGSSLGGQIIARTVHERLGLTPETGTAYFSRGAARRAAWPRFKERLNAGVRTPVEIDASVAAARSVFTHFIDTAAGTWPAATETPSHV